MRGLVVGAAFLAALITGTGHIAAQSPYGVGGYLERGYDLGEDDAIQAAPPERTPDILREALRNIDP